MAIDPRTPHPDDAHTSAFDALRWPRRLTLAGLWAERLTRAFWPLWTILLLAFAAAAFELHQIGALMLVRLVAGTFALAGALALVWGIWRFRAPTPAEALARLDASLPGRPISALQDRQAIGATDPASAAVWQAHLARMAKRAGEARPVAPDLRLSSRDPFALRYVALTAAVMAALFGSLWRVTEVAGIAPGPAQATPGGPVWEGWARPPAYTGKPTLYLNDIPEGPMELPAGTRLQIRAYGPEGALQVEQTIAQVAPQPDQAMPAGAAPTTIPGLTELTLSQSGRLAITGKGGREWQVTMIPDAAPTVHVSGAITRDAKGRFKQGFTAQDDHGVTSGQVTITLDMGAVTRRHGLTVDPEPFAPVTLDLPMPVRGKRTEVKEVLIDDLSESLLANMPVSMVFSVSDAAGNTGKSAPYFAILPGLRFFDPMAAAVAELRRDLLWNRANLARSTQLIKALLYRPQDLTRSQGAVKRLRVLMRQMDAITPAAFTPETRDEVAAELWHIAQMFEEGDLGSAAERLQRAQDRLEEAIRNGASPEEIDQLMKEMQQAMKEYTRELGRQPQDKSQAQGESKTITGDQLQQMLDEIEKLMKEGRTAEAMQKMEELRQLMENLQVQQGAEGEGQDGAGKGPVQDLGKTLKDQQGLSDDAYRDMQRGRNGQNPGQEGQEGQPDQGDLADRQRELRERLGDMQRGKLPGDGRESGEAGRDALDRAEEAMREAEEALKDGDLSGALDRQAEAMQEMREGMRNFREAEDQDRREKAMENGEDPEPGRQSREGKDPLGRDEGNAARIGSDNNLAMEDPDQRARDLLDEIRRRSGEAQRPDAERDYLRRLLDLF